MKFLYFSFALLPISLISGPFLPDATLSIGSLILLIIILKSKEYFYFNNEIFILLGIIYLIFFISSLLSNDVLFSFESSLFYFRYIFFTISIIYLSSRTNFLKYFFIFSIIAILVLMVDSYWEFFTDYTLIGNRKTDDPSRISSLFGDELILGSYLARLTPIIFGLFYFYNFQKTNYKYLFGALFLNIYILVFISGERTAFILINIFLILYVMKYLNFKSIIFISTLFSFLFYLFISNYPIVKDRMYIQTQNSISQIFMDQNKILPGVYDNMLKTSFNMFKSNKFFGIGPKMYRKECSINDYGINNQSCFTHPHNNYIQLISETGLFGLIAFIIYYLILFKRFVIKCFKSYKEFNRKDHLSFFMLSSILINFIPFIPSGSFFNNWLNIFYFLPLGIYIYSEKHSYEKK